MSARHSASQSPFSSTERVPAARGAAAGACGSRMRASPSVASVRGPRVRPPPRRVWGAWRSRSSRTWPARRRSQPPRPSTRRTTSTAGPTTSARWWRCSCGARSGSRPRGHAAPSRRRAFRTRWSPEARASEINEDPRGRQRPRPSSRGGAARVAARRAPRRPRPQGRQALVRHPGVRRLHGAGRRPRGERLHLSGGGNRRALGPDRRGAGRRRVARPAPARVSRRRRRAVRLLHLRHAAHGECVAPREPGADPRRRPPLSPREPLPLHGLPEDRRGGLGRCGDRPVSARPLRVVGRPVPRVDGLEKVTGRARYVTDLVLPGMAHAKVLRSPYAHARVRRVDVARAGAREGVFAALSSAALPGWDPYLGRAFRDGRVPAMVVARHEGEPVAAVAAVDEATAEEALELIDVDYELLPSAITLEQALGPGAPLVHTGEPLSGHFADLATLRPQPGTNVCHRFHFERGDAVTALAGADLVVEDTYRFPPVQHVALEPHAVLAAWDETGALTLWASTQNPYSVRVELAKMFGLPLARIRVIVPHLGGGFGSKTYAKLEPLAAALARAAGRPVRLAASVPEAFQTVRRCAARVGTRVGFRRDGTLVAVECAADYDVGAYADIGPRVVQKATYTATGPYRVPHVELDARAGHANTTPGGAFRGFGVPQLAWALESLFDVAADRLDRDPVDLRRQNFLAHGEEFAPGDTPIDGKLEESLGRAAEAIGWTRAGAADRGRGVAAMLKASVAPSVSEAIVRLHTDGSVSVLASAVEMGQGTRTVLAQIAAEVLSVSLDRVTVVQPDTAVTPYDQTTSSSRSTTMTGRAVQVASEDVREQLLRIAADALGVTLDLTLDDGAVVAPARLLPYAEVLLLRFGMSGG